MMFKKLFFVISFISFLVLTNTASAADPNLVGWWKLDEGFGNTAYDSSIYGNNGTITGGPDWIDGRIKGALQFSGQAQYIDCQAGESLNITKEITLSLWVDTNDAGDNLRHSYMMKGEMTYGLKHTTSNNIQFYIYYDGYHEVLTPVTEAFNGQWHHLAGTFDGQVMKLYIDGVLMGSTQYKGGINRDNNYALSFGRNNQGDGLNQWYYEGFLDDIRVYNRALSQQEIQDMLSPEYASMPSPEDGAQYEEPDVVLKWVPGSRANTHDVYLGTVFNDVNQASRTDQRNVLVSQNTDANSFEPAGLLELDQTYYWRIDEVDAPPSNTRYKGPVWSFTVPFAFPIKQITAAASSSDANKGPENTVNGSGLDKTGLLHDKISKDCMWLSSRTGEQPTWILFEFNKVYKLHEMWVWNSNDSFELSVGLGIKNAVIEYSVDGINYTTLGTTHEFAQAPAVSNYAHNTTIDFDDVLAKYVRITANSNWKGLLKQYGLSEVRFFYVPVSARMPNPTDGLTDVALDVTLTWKAGREAAEHKVYISKDEQAVINGNAPVSTYSMTSYGPLALDLNSIYYWRVDEVNNAETPSVWQGDIWSFKTSEYIVVDGFEIGYDDTDANAVWATWIDGYGNELVNGALIGYAFPGPYLSTTNHSGGHSAPLNYNNTIASYSEITAQSDELPIGTTDWTTGNPDTLVIWFMGDANNASTDRLYMKLNNKKLVYNGPAADISSTTWIPWEIDIPSLGVNLSNISSITIGLERSGSNGGSGILYIDDIQLYVRLDEEAILE
ncbi:MAG: discoidin domain-containing protein [Sedimentisphaerales bacterium]|nr:discoidin domain-containing protein [Sedimentisphaerales bacterium]